MSGMLPRSSRIAVLNGPKSLSFVEQDLPEPQAGQVTCETLVSAISAGTELAAYQGLPPLRRGTAYPRLQGYCNVARVLACGAEVQELLPGQRVLSFQSHRSHFTCAADEVLLKIPDGVTDAAAATTYLFHLGYNAVLRADVRAGARVLVIGLGALGLTATACAAMAGAEVRAISAQSESRFRAVRMGAVQAMSREDARQACAGWADVVIATTNTWSDWSLALSSAGMRGTIAVLGFPGRGEPKPENNPLDSEHFYMRQLRIEAVGHSPERPDARGFARFNERDNLRFLMSRLASGALHWQELVTAEFPAARLDDAYMALLRRERDAVTFLLKWQRD